MSATEARKLEHILAQPTDVLGNKELAAADGPTFAASNEFPPLLYAIGAGGRPLTTSGVYYLPLGIPSSASGTSDMFLVVADGSEILSRQTTGSSVQFMVGADGRERFGSCLWRLHPAKLARGWLPIVDTEYVDGTGSRFEQESFVSATTGASARAFIRFRINARAAAATDRLHLSAKRGSRVITIPPGSRAIVYFSWAGGQAPVVAVSAAAYAAARGQTIAFWNREVDRTAPIRVPEARVDDAERALLVQNLELGWRYSVGNAYQEFSFPESLDSAEVMAEYGFQAATLATLQASLSRGSSAFPSWKIGARLVTAAEYARLYGASTLRRDIPVLARYVQELASSFRGKLLPRERYSSDIPLLVFGLPGEAVAWEGLNTMAPIWASLGRPDLAGACVRLARRLRHGLLGAVAQSSRHLGDGSLFIPVILLDGEQPYSSLSATRLGTYWNLVMPYALASGVFDAGSTQERGVLAYVIRHGSRILGLVRAGGPSIFGPRASYSGSGTDEVYGENMARFLADEDASDQLTLSLYGELAAAMTAQTFVSGEGASVAPFRGQRFRSMYLPPNSTSNSSFLETLRLLLVHETLDSDRQPFGLQLAYATPREWLTAGKKITVTKLPTSFGRLTYTITTDRRSVAVSIDLERDGRLRLQALSLRLRLPAGAVISQVRIVGHAKAQFDSKTDVIELPPRSGVTNVVALYRKR